MKDQKLLPYERRNIQDALYDHSTGNHEATEKTALEHIKWSFKGEPWFTLKKKDIEAEISLHFMGRHAELIEGDGG